MFVFVSKYGDALCVAYKIQLEGYRLVSALISEEKNKEMFDGMLHKQDVFAYSPNDNIVIFDMVGFGKEAERLKKLGYTVIGAHPLCDRIEKERSYGIEVVRAGGISVPETYVFNTVEEAFAFEPPHGGNWYFKPEGNAPTNTTFKVSAEDYGPLAKVLARDLPADWDQPILIQAEVKGIEVSTEVWLRNGEVLWPANHTFEDKRFLAGNLGPNTGCSGNVVIVPEESRLAEHLFNPKLFQTLGLDNYIGPLDINAIVTEDDAYFLEFTARFGYDALQTLLFLNNRALTEVFEILTRSSGYPFDFPEGYLAYGQRITIPPYPYRDPEYCSKGTPIRYKEKDEPHIWWGDVKRDDEGRLVCAGADGNLAVITTKARSYKAAKAEWLDIVERFQVPDLQYKLDGADRFETDALQLQKWGWIKF